MKIYNHHSYGEGTIFITPGAHHPETSDWVDQHTKMPIMFAVKFNKGMAEVSDPIGKYLLANKLAQKNPVILPAEEFLRQSAEIERLTRENIALADRLKSAGVAA